jgi:translation initiation factor 2B subunit (eIF-2B alpha/beta/delta family)
VALLPADIQAEIAAIAADRLSGASYLLERAIGVLRRALAGDAAVESVARAVHLAQPSMAGLLNAALEAMAASGHPERFDRFAERVRRGATAIARWGLSAFEDMPAPVRIVTVSASRSVLTIVLELSKRRPVHVTCAEAQPAREGRALAARLAAADIGVTLVSDPAIATALPEADAVLVGADAVTPAWFVNKVGTRMLAAAASHAGTPFYVAATREKFLGELASRRLSVGTGDPSEIWDTPPNGVEVRNPYFETTPLDLVTALITDSGVLGAGTVADVCAAAPDDHWLDGWPLPGNGTTQLP